VTAPTQFPLVFTPGLTAQFRTLEDCIAATVLSHRGGIDDVAPALDMSPSELSRRLNAHVLAKEGDSSNRPLRVTDMVLAISKTKDFRPIFWLVERFLQDPEAQRTQAIHQLANIMPVVQALIEQAAPNNVKAMRR